jgi:hypothetical protein
MSCVFEDPSQIPSRPSDQRWAAQLRWALAVMDDNDKSMAFIASCFSNLMKYGGLSEKQADACSRVIHRIDTDFHDGALNCLRDEADDDGRLLSHMPTRGHC